MAEMTTTPSANGEAPLPRRRPRGLLPTTWLGRGVKLDYTGSSGEASSTTATLLELFPFGPVLSIEGAKTAVSWDAIRVVELQDDWS